MSDLISRTTVAEEIKKVKEAVKTHPKSDYNTGYIHGLKRAEVIIEDNPTIDAVPVVHGEWLVLNGKLVKCFECSACHALNDYKTRHCPFCGADMRKGGSNE